MGLKRGPHLPPHIKKARLILAALSLGSFLIPHTLAAATGDAQSRAPVDALESNSLLGSYLAGKIARSARDNDVAAFYYKRALQRDPSNSDLLEDAFQLELAAGKIDTAKQLAFRLTRRDKSNLTAQIFLALDAIRRENYSRAEDSLKNISKSSDDEPTTKLTRAWLAAARGQSEKALSLLEPKSKVPWAAIFENTQRAYMADVLRKKQVADEAYAELYDPKTPNGRLGEAYARHLAFWGDKQRALEILAESGADKLPTGKALAADLAANKTPKLIVTTPEEGLADVFTGIGEVLAASNGLDAALIYLQLALILNPTSEIAILDLSEVHGALSQYPKAIEILDKIRPASSNFTNVQLRKAVYLNALDNADEAINLLKTLLEKTPDDPQALQTLATIYASRKNYAESLPYYDRAISLIKEPQKNNYRLYYARGIAFERTKQWDKAEADFKKALELNPNEPEVLNYLGYSWLDQGIKVPEAFELIQKAVNLRPNDGYIVDSLGWGYYLQKNYPEALKTLERAVDIRPGDATLNDHLGDVYWRVGRELEARYQWSQALSLSPEPDEAEKIKKKLEGGLQADQGEASPERKSTSLVKDKEGAGEAATR